jgi:exosortase J
MSALPDSEISVPLPFSRGLSSVQFAGLALAASVLGLSTIWPTILTLWGMWTTDALKSIGMIVPIASLVLIVRVWQTLEWRAQGTWWGLLLVLITIAAAWTQQQAILFLVISPHWITPLPPPSLVLFAYGSGVVLLLGGVQLYKAALFPIVLLLFANPVPHIFSLLVDLPLQGVSAHIARSFAMHLGQPLTPDHLRLMFTPEFGMFIAPGCNGIRGALTMGFIALIAGYVYRFRWYMSALVVIGAVLLGYVFNLLRLCLLVLYYLVALHFTSLQNKAENADYMIGAALFLFATILLFTIILRLRDGRIPNPQESDAIPQDTAYLPPARSMQYAALCTMTAISLFGCVGLARAMTGIHPSANSITEAAARRFPAHLGKYTLVRSWNETLVTGNVVYVWAQYAPAGGGTPIAIGMAPILGWHDPLICHYIRGEHPLWQGQMTVATSDVVPVGFSSAFYTDGVTQYLEASTQCTESSCGEFSTERTHFGLVYSRPDPKSLFSSNGQRAIPVLIRAETLDMTVPPDAARQQLAEDLRAFLASVSLDGLARP